MTKNKKEKQLCEGQYIQILESTIEFEHAQKHNYSNSFSAEKPSQKQNSFAFKRPMSL